MTIIEPKISRLRHNIKNVIANLEIVGVNIQEDLLTKEETISSLSSIKKSLEEQFFSLVQLLEEKN